MESARGKEEPNGVMKRRSVLCARGKLAEGSDKLAPRIGFWYYRLDEGLAQSGRKFGASLKTHVNAPEKGTHLL